MSYKNNIIILESVNKVFGERISRCLNAYPCEKSLISDIRKIDKLLVLNQIDLLIIDYKDFLGLTDFYKFLFKKLFIPMLVLNAKNQDLDNFEHLDFVEATENYSLDFFLPHIKNLLQKKRLFTTSKNNKSTIIYYFSRWILHDEKMCLIASDGEKIVLNKSEHNLLKTFLELPKQILTRDQLLLATQRRFPSVFDRSIDIQISRIRNKLEINPKNPDLLKTVRGCGYTLTTEVRKTSSLSEYAEI